MTLVNLARLTEQATYSDQANIALIAAAPEMAELLQGCHWLLDALAEGMAGHPEFPNSRREVSRLLARLAEFDRGFPAAPEGGAE